jgi:hypothetical protein
MASGDGGMNDPITPDVVRSALAKTRSKNLLNAPGWEPYFAKWAADLNQFVERYRSRFGESLDPVGLLSSSEAKGAAFWELDTLRLSVEMKIAVWRILLGSDISAIELEENENLFHLTIQLKTPYGTEETYESKESADIRMLRHLGAIEVNGATQFQGYYAFA